MYKAAAKAYRFFVENKGKPVSPNTLEETLGVGPYNSQHIWYLKTNLGCKFDVTKDGRNVVSYTLIDHDEKVPAEVLKYEEKQSKKTDTSTKIVKATKEKVKKTTKSKSVKTMPAKYIQERDVPEFIDPAYSVDGDFDSIDVDELGSLGLEFGRESEYA